MNRFFEIFPSDDCSDEELIKTLNSRVTACTSRAVGIIQQESGEEDPIEVHLRQEFGEEGEIRVVDNIISYQGEDKRVVRCYAMEGYLGVIEAAVDEIEAATLEEAERITSCKVQQEEEL